MSIYTYEPEKRDEILNRRAKGLWTPEGAILHGQWSAISGGRVFSLFELNDPLIAAQWSQVWSDLGKMEIVPVVDTDMLMKALAAKK